jgi:hypothetical protein
LIAAAITVPSRILAIFRSKDLSYRVPVLPQTAGAQRI